MRWLLKFRVFIIVTLAVGLIIAAISFSLARAILPYATGYKTEIETELSQQIGLPVRIERIDADMHWFSPRLNLLQVSVYNTANKVPLFHFKKLFFELDTIHSLLRGELVVGEISLVGTDISIEKLAKNRWRVQGIEIKNTKSTGMMDKLLYTLQHANYSLFNSNIYYRDITESRLELNLLDVNINVDNSSGSHTLELSMNLPSAYGKHLRIIAELKGELISRLDKTADISGNFYINATGIKINQWDKKFKWRPEFSLSGSINSSIWGRLKNNKLTEIVTQLSATNLSIANSIVNTNYAYNKKSSSWKVDKLSTSLRLVKFPGQWHLNISNLEMVQANKTLWPQPANLIAKFNENSLFVNADFLRLQDIIKVAGIVVADKSKLSRLNEMKVTGDVYNLQLNYSAADVGKTQLQGDFVNLGLTLQQVPFSVVGLDAGIQLKKNKINIQLFSQQVTVTLENLFRDPLEADVLTGNAVISLSEHFLKDHAWSLSAPLLHIKNKHIDTYSRLRLTMPPAASSAVASAAMPSNKKRNRPRKILQPPSLFVDMQTNFYEALTQYTSHYLPVGIMSKGLVGWLDKSINNGYVKNGQFILYGNVSDFPYTDGTGVMEVLFHPTGINLKFLDNWPVITDLSAKIKFYNESMFITDGRGKSKRANLSKLSAEIKNLNKPLLKINAKAVSSIKNLQAYVWNSPLDKFLGNTFRLFRLDGDAVLDLSLNIPLSDKNIKPVYKGKLRLDHASLYYPELSYSLKNVNGFLNFTENSITSNNLHADIDGSPLNISAHTINQREKPEVIFNIDGDINIDTLLGAYKSIPPNWLSGVSLWHISVAVPFHPENYLVHVDVASSLKGVSIAMSDRVSKSKKESVPVTVSIDVLEHNILHFNLKSKDVMSLHAVRNNAGIILYKLDSPFITGSGSFDEKLDKATSLSMRLEKLDLHALVTSKVNRQSSKTMNPADFPPLDLHVKKLYWDNWTFNDVRLKTSWQQHGMIIDTLKLNGPAMSFDAKGTWLTSWRYKNQTTLSGNLHSDDMGKTLTGLGFEKSIDKSKFDTKFNASWLAEPYSLSWKNVKGKATFNLKQGTIPAINPGAGGRLLGLMNIFQLTNRLALNFKDVYRKGFSFDKIDGELDFKSGEGKLKNFNVKAPAADIKMFGSVGLLKHNYDLLMRVKPHSNGLTFAGGALLGGVVVGAGLALIQKVFNISLIDTDVYTITGTWKKPLIKKIIDKKTTTDDEDDGYSF